MLIWLNGGISTDCVCHAKGEYARDEDGDGFHSVHVNTMEGFWSLLRSWLRPHRDKPTWTIRDESGGVWGSR